MIRGGSSSSTTTEMFTSHLKCPPALSHTPIISSQSGDLLCTLNRFFSAISFRSYTMPSHLVLWFEEDVWRIWGVLVGSRRALSVLSPGLSLVYKNADATSQKPPRTIQNHVISENIFIVQMYVVRATDRSGCSAPPYRFICWQGP